MPFLVLFVVIAALTWWFVRRTQGAPALSRRAGWTLLIVALAAAVAVRAPAPLRLVIVAAALVSLAVWLSRRGGGGGGGPGDDDPPVDPDPGPSHHVDLPDEAEVLDRDAFDVARDAWERELPKRS